MWPTRTCRISWEFGATTPGLFARVANDNKKLRAKLLKDAMNLDPATEPDKALKANIHSRLARLTCARSTCIARHEVEVKVQAERPYPKKTHARTGAKHLL